MPGVCFPTRLGFCLMDDQLQGTHRSPCPWPWPLALRGNPTQLPGAQCHLQGPSPAHWRRCSVLPKQNSSRALCLSLWLHLHLRPFSCSNWSLGLWKIPNIIITQASRVCRELMGKWTTARKAVENRHWSELGGEVCEIVYKLSG